jgi:hypothetical protein
MARRPASTRLGLLAAAFYAAHAVELVLRTPAENLLWSCNVASIAVAAGLLLGSPTWSAAGGLLLVVGQPIWILDLATGGAFLPTSLLTHVGVAVLSLLGARRLGVPKRAWIAGAALLAAATVASRVVSSTKENVNLSQAIPPGWEFFPSHGLYLVCLGTLLCGAMLGVQSAVVRLWLPSTRRTTHL